MMKSLARPAAAAIIALALAPLSPDIAQQAKSPSAAHEPTFLPTLILAEQYPSPVLTIQSPGAEGNKYGFEGGRVIKLDGIYHLFTSEMTGDPMWVKMKLAHWSSKDRVRWARVSTLYESSGEFSGRDGRAALWSPLPVYDPREERWNLFYIAYRSAPDTKTEWRGNYDGSVWRAVSRTRGLEGIGGPYADVGIVLQPDVNSQPWEGLQGTDSFFPYQVGNRWLAFYGSANTEHLPIEHWRVGLAEAPRIAGPWKRCSGTNPVNIEPKFAENPIVTRLDDGTYLAVYDTDVTDPVAIGYTWSRDGVSWAPGRHVVVQPKGVGFWADPVRTPLGLVPEGGGRFTVFYTGYQKPSAEKGMGFGSIGFATLKLGGRP